MDPQNFDSLVRKLGSAASRRRALRAILTGLVVPLLPALAEADRQKGKTNRGGKGGKKQGQDRDNGNAKNRGRDRGKGHGRKKGKRNSANNVTTAGSSCREAGHPCEGNQTCCDDLVCIASGPGAAERCTPCGDAGEPCCADDVCGDGLVCDEGACVGCGGDGQRCCADETCDDEFVCDASSGLCTACGGEDQPCCPSATCDGGFVCDEGGTCVACGSAEGQLCCDEGPACGDGLICQGNSCVACGGDGDLCCADGNCDTGFTCDPDGLTCVACGDAANQLCCDEGPPCGDGLICGEGNVCLPCGGDGQLCCAEESCSAGLVCDAESGLCASCDANEVICITDDGGQCIPGVCCEEGEGPGCAEDETCIAGGCINDNQVRIVLRWGANPRDIDSHLWLPPGSPYHVFWFDKGTVNAFPFAELDIDDVTSFGPETITIADLQAGTYLYAVHLYAGDGTIGTSEAEVQVFKGANLLRTYSPPAEGPWDEQDPLADPYNDRRIWWTVFELTSDGTDAAITDINAASTDPAPYGNSGPLLRIASAGIPRKPPVAESAPRRRRGRRKGKNRGRARQ